MNKPLAAALVLSFAAFAGPAAAEESLSSRAASAVGAVIASQGNAALVQIRQELKDTLLEQRPPDLARHRLGKRHGDDDRVGRGRPRIAGRVALALAPEAVLDAVRARCEHAAARTVEVTQAEVVVAVVGDEDEILEHQTRAAAQWARQQAFLLVALAVEGREQRQ